jgi:hypothetical protein
MLRVAASGKPLDWHVMVEPSDVPTARRDGPREETVAGPTLDVGNSFDGVYSGKRGLTKGSGPRCPAENDVSIAVRGEILTFTNSTLQNFLIEFAPHQDGSFRQIYVDAGGDTVTIQGRATGGFLDAEVTNPPCEYHWHPKKG